MIFLKSWDALCDGLTCVGWLGAIQVLLVPGMAQTYSELERQAFVWTPNRTALTKNLPQPKALAARMGCPVPGNRAPEGAWTTSASAFVACPWAAVTASNL